jgi:hypothetical protein
VRNTPAPDGRASRAADAAPDAQLASGAQLPSGAAPLPAPWDTEDGETGTSDTLWAGIMAERDSGSWRNLPRDQSAPDTTAGGTDPEAAWASGSGSQSGAGWDFGPSATGDAGDSTGPDEDPASSSAAGKPGERRPRHAGKHGRPARRPWDRPGKDRDGEQ